MVSFRRCSDWLQNCSYVLRLRQMLWVPIFVLLLQLLLTVHLVQVSGDFFASGVGLTETGVLMRCMYRSLFWATLVWLLVSVSRGRGGRWLLWGIVSFLILLHFVESFLLATYGMGYAHPILLAIAGTNPQEASEYWTSAFSILPLLRPLGEVILAGVVTWGVKYLLRKLPASTPKSAVLGGALAVFVLLISHVVFVIPNTYRWVMNFGTAFDLTMSPMDRLVWNSVGFAHETYLVRKGAEEMRSLDVGKVVAQEPYGSMNVVVVIGETLRRDQMHCYGHPLPNTPGLDSLVAAGDLMLFSDVVSPGTSTIESLTHVLTLKQVDDVNPWYTYPALPYILSRAGYHVRWVSNQESTGAIVQPLNSLAALSDYVKYVHARSIDGDRDEQAADYDIDVVPQLKVLRPGEQKMVQFVHLEGSHPLYSKRFPKEYARFKPAEMPARLTGEQKQVLSDYINSVYYNDYVVTQIIRRYASTPSLVIYFSDHGEVLYDDPEHPDFAGHSRTKPCAEVPFMVYISPALRAQAPQLVNLIQSAKDRRIMNDLFTNSLVALLGIKTKYSDPRLEFFGEGYDTSRPRILRGWGKELRF